MGTVGGGVYQDFNGLSIGGSGGNGLNRATGGGAGGSIMIVYGGGTRGSTSGSGGRGTSYSGGARGWSSYQRWAFGRPSGGKWYK